MNNSRQILKQTNDIRDELVRVRRWFHSLPELSFEEYGTAAFIAEYLKGLGLEVQTGVAKTGVVALLRGGLPGNTVGLRADIDALPVTEENDYEFKSQNVGKMHACGHDGHTAVLLGTARQLTANRDKLKGTVKFIFQPAEENVSGARAMINEGVLKNPDVDLMLALHIIPDIDSGHIEVKSGVTMSSMDEFLMTIHGKGGHGSNPQNAIDPIMTGAQLVMALQTIVSRKVSPIQPAVVSVCQFIAGTKSNTIPPTAYLSGTIRCQDEGVRRFIFEQLDVITKGICSTAGATCDLKINEQIPAVVNDKEVFDDFVRCSSGILEKDKIELPEKARTYSEDFSLFGNLVPSVYFFLGSRNVQKDCIYPLHSPKFKIDEDVLPLGAALLTNYCLNRSLNTRDRMFETDVMRKWMQGLTGPGLK